MSAYDPKRTSLAALHMSAFDPKRTLADDGTQRPLSHEVEITTGSAYCPSGHASSDDPNPHHDNAGAPSGHASSVAPTARPSDCRGQRWQPQEAGGSVPLGSFRTRPQKLDLQFRLQILCATYAFSPVVGASLFTEAVRTTDQLKNKTSRSMNGHSARNKTGAPCFLRGRPTIVRFR
jgi:hypothetical protein